MVKEFVIVVTEFPGDVFFVSDPSMDQQALAFVQIALDGTVLVVPN